MSTINLLYKDRYTINEHISVMIPTVGSVIENEDNYYGLVAMLTAMPIDLMCELDDAGVDFTTITEYQLFLMLFPSIAEMDTHLIFGDLDLSKFVLGINQQNGNTVMFDPESGAVIDKAIHGRIAATLRKIHHLEKNKRKPGNQEAKDYMLERAKIKRQRRKKSSFSELESLIVALVNTEQFKYDYEGTLDMSIYRFNESLRQVSSKIEYDHRMNGVYFGTVDLKGLSQDELTWLSHK